MLSATGPEFCHAPFACSVPSLPALLTLHTCTIAGRISIAYEYFLAVHEMSASCSCVQLATELLYRAVMFLSLSTRLFD